jgi:hypothetical protein
MADIEVAVALDVAARLFTRTPEQPKLLCLEQGPCKAALANDRLQRADPKLRMIGDRHGHAGPFDPPLHDHVAPSSPHLHEAVGS